MEPQPVVQPVVVQPVRANPLDPLSLILGLVAVVLSAFYVLAALIVLFTDSLANEAVRRLLELSTSTSQAIPFLAIGALFGSGPVERLLGRIALVVFALAILILALHGQIDFGERYRPGFPGF